VSSSQVLLIEPDRKTATFLTRAMSERGYEVTVSDTGKEGLIAAWRDQPDIIVLELELPDLDGLEVVRRLRKESRTERKTIIAMTQRSKPEETLAGLDVGLDYYVVKQADAVDVLLRLMARSALPEVVHHGEPEKPLGALIPFVSAKGGVGTTSVCLNVACHIARADAEKSIVVVDLVLPIGNVAQITGVKTQTDIVSLTELEPMELSVELLRRELPQAAAWGFTVVPGCKDPAQAMRLQAQRLGPAIQTLRAAYDMVIIDIGRNISRLAMMVLSQATSVAVVMSPDPTSAANSRAILQYMQSEAILGERIFVISNRALGVEDLTGPPLEAIVGRPVDRGIPNIGKNFNLANNLHAPLHMRFPDEAAVDALKDIADGLIEKSKPRVVPGQRA
jgi:MinD-like ATPase involved in chromosome partitioning or flagellar assembly/ActR/RegA family two-component response regulator